MTTDPATRQWHLQAFKKVDGKEEWVYTSICHGDKALGDAMTPLEKVRYGPKKKRLRIIAKAV